MLEERFEELTVDLFLIRGKVKFPSKIDLQELVFLLENAPFTFELGEAEKTLSLSQAGLSLVVYENGSGLICANWNQREEINDWIEMLWKNYLIKCQKKRKRK